MTSVSSGVGQGAPLTAPGRVRSWVLTHDDSRLFVVAYIGLAVVLSVAISLFWLVAVVGLHYMLEVVRQHHAYRTLPRALSEAAWEIRLDVALVLFAFALTLYMDVLLGIVGLQSAARVTAASRAGARVVAWQRVLRGVILSLDDVAQMARAAVSRRRRAGSRIIVPPDNISPSGIPSWRQWSTGTMLTLALGVGSAFLILGAPYLTDHTSSSALAALLPQMHPWPR